jgi:uncharacterized protein YkuJ
MAHVRKQIRDRIATLVTGLATTGSNVYKMRRYALDQDKLPAVVVYTNDETSNLQVMGTINLDRVLSVSVQAFVSGASTSVFDTLDTIAVEIEEAIAADFTLNGLAKRCHLTGTSVDINPEAEKAIGEVTLTYEVQYRTTISDVETAQ